MKKLLLIFFVLLITNKTTLSQSFSTPNTLQLKTFLNTPKIKDTTNFKEIYFEDFKSQIDWVGGSNPNAIWYNQNVFGNFGIHNFQPSNIIIDESGNGYLKLKMNYQPNDQFEFTEAMIMTHDRLKFGYGKFEIKCQIPTGVGKFPAFWGFGGDINSSHNTEIDFFEIASGTNTNSNILFNTTHLWWGEDPDTNNHSTNFMVEKEGLSNSMHIYTTEWTPYVIRWFLDGEKTWEYYHWMKELDGGAITTPIFDQFYGEGIENVPFGQDSIGLILNSAFNSDELLDPLRPDKLQQLQNETFPQELLVDYIRVSKWKNCIQFIELNNQSIINYNNGNSFKEAEVIICGDNGNVPTGNSLSLIASNYIKLNDGFFAKEGSFFSALIDSNLCNIPVLKSADDNSISENQPRMIKFDSRLSLNNLNRNRLPESEKYYDYDKSLNIFEWFEYKSIFEVYDSSGKLIGKGNSLNNFKSLFSLLQKGLYTVIKYDKKNKYSYNKFIK